MSIAIAERPSETLPLAGHEAATTEEREERLLAVSRWLLEGQSRQEAVAAAQTSWGLGRRMAQLDVQEAQRRLAAEAAEEQRLYYLRLSQLQRDQLVKLAMRHLQKAEDLDPRILRLLINLLDSRDRTATAIHEHLGQVKNPALVKAETNHLIARMKAMQERSRQLLAADPPKPQEPPPRKPARVEMTALDREILAAQQAPVLPAITGGRPNYQRGNGMAPKAVAVAAGP